ncbi:MAG: PTS sugar transporter subunit IIA [Chitinispirillaceae bacterium]|nr:PTS sugar transporter subunit IIA [Chitinispirillaceae bacterium]
MIELKDFLSLEDVSVAVSVESKERAIAYAVELLVNNHNLKNGNKLLLNLLEREKLGSTGIGDGIGIPHTFCEDIHKTLMAVLKLTKPIEYYSPDGKPVDIIFCIVGPKNYDSQHLRLLSKLARILRSSELRDSLHQAHSSLELWELIVSQE